MATLFRIAILDADSNAVIAIAKNPIRSVDCPLESLKQQIEFLPAAIVNVPMPPPKAGAGE